MSLPVVLSLEAEGDFDAAADWYEDQAGLGERFTLQVRKALNQIGQMPELHALLYQEIRRAKIDKFPYHVYYRVQRTQVEVIAVVHGRRDPSVWKSRA